MEEKDIYHAQIGICACNNPHRASRLVKRRIVKEEICLVEKNENVILNFSGTEERPGISSFSKTSITAMVI